MKLKKSDILFKGLWIVLLLTTIYFFSWLTFGFFIIGNIGSKQFTIWNLIIPNILTIGLLIVYSKEILTGYKPKSKNGNQTSLILLSTLIFTLFFLQRHQFELLIEDSQSEYWQVILPLIIILTSYIGIILNRLLKLKELKSQ